MTVQPSISLAGIFPPIPTPFQADESLALDHLRANLERWNQRPLTGYVVGGSNGEFVYLSEAERLRVIETTHEFIPADRLLIAGTGMESTRGTLELTRQAAQHGADAALIVTPSYFRARMDERALTAHYLDLAEQSPLPLILYSVPANTGIDLPLGVILRLSQHPKIIGIKDSGGSVAKLGAIMKGAPPDFQILAGSASFTLGALAVGAVGVVAALANLAADQLADLLTLFHKGDLEAARTLQLNLIEANSAVTSTYGVAGLKAALDMQGFYGGPVRSPLQALDHRDRAALREIMLRAGLI
jgi:4-hydroxy-2-oxoglutarate aldolase